MILSSPSRRPSWWAFAALALASGSALAAPTAVSIPGSHQNEAGCSSDWDPACEATQLKYEAADDVWQHTFTLPAGSYDFKAALNKGWDENYGAKGVKGGPNIKLELAAAAPVKFYYDDKTHWVTSNRTSFIATATGTFQSELGCSGDSQPDCLRTWLQDVDGDGIYTLSTAPLPAGTYEGKVAINESLSESYGAGGTVGDPNVGFVIPEGGDAVTFRWDSTTKVFKVTVGVIRGDLAKAKAFWLTRDTLAWNVATAAGSTYRLHHDAAAGLGLDVTGVLGGQSFALTHVGGLPEALRAKFPHLKDYGAFRVAEADLPQVKELLRGQVVVSAVSATGRPVDATGVQTAGALDDLYPYTGELGVSWSDGKPTLRLWAPTARDVKLLVYPDAASPMATTVTMTRDDATGVWSAPGEADWKNKFYLYEVTVFVRGAGKVSTHTVTDPYSLSLAMNSRRSQVVDLEDPALKPQGWDSVEKPALAAPEDIVLYELHIRDFSASDATVPAEHRGGYLAFTDLESNGMKHLSRLAKAGLTHVHLLPAFDIASVDEDRSTWQQPTGDLASFPGNSPQQREAVSAVMERDAFNWGYDPFHFGVPEGSYATDPNGSKRILEFRQMVQSLNASGLRVVMDVVYNHTNASGLADKSVLDKVVPDYYHRLNLEGAVERSTCCENTATEHAMMEKLMVDTLKLWTRAYKVDGYRFDLMGHHMKSNMLKVRDTLTAFTPAADGVDGSKLYIYGEGWNFGEVENNARGENAVQRNMAGTGIGTFNDRLRDGARGGNPFTPRTHQGYLTGLFFTPNAKEERDTRGQLDHLLDSSDLIRAGLAASLREYVFMDAKGKTAAASELSYNGQPAAYTADPQEVINYVSAHDNETLFDGVQVKVPLATDMNARVRVNNLGVALVMLSQGIPFFHAGDEVLRSKSGDHNSYNSGDWFNRLDWTYASNNWGVGLPINSDDAVLTPLLARPELKPTRTHILRSLDHFEEMLRIRKSSKLFRLETAEQVKAAVKLLNVGPTQEPGIIAVSTTNAQNFPDEYEQVVTFFNAAPYDQKLRVEELKGVDLRLHPVQQDSTDPLMRRASFDVGSGAVVVPARSAAVFVKGKLSGPGEGVVDGEGCGGCAQGGSTGLALVGLLLMAHATRRRGTRAAR